MSAGSIWGAQQTGPVLTEVIGRGSMQICEGVG